MKGHNPGNEFSTLRIAIGRSMKKSGFQLVFATLQPKNEIIGLKHHKNESKICCN